MTYASDKLKNGFIRRNRSRIANEVKALEILLHLPCLTTTDMEEVEAAFRRMGNTYAMSQLLDNLTRRENWPEEFIRALEECEHPTLAQEMSEAYEALKQPKQRQKPVAPSAGPAVVTSPHVLTPSSIAAHPPVHPSVSVQSAPLPTLSERSAFPPSRTPERPYPPNVPTESLIYPNTSNQPAFHPNVAASTASAPSLVLVPPVNSPSAAPAAQVLQPEVAQAQRLAVTPEPDITNAPKSGVTPADISEPPSLSPDPQTPLHTNSPGRPQPTKLAIQETCSPSCKGNPLQQKSEDTSNPTLHQVSSTHRHPTASYEDREVHRPPHGTKNIAPPATVPVSAPVVAMTHRTLPRPIDSDPEDEFFSKPGVLQSFAAEPCSLTSDDLELSVTQEPEVCPAPVLQSDQVSNFTEANHSRGSVNIHNSGSPSCQSDGLVDDPALSPNHVSIEDHFESVRRNSADQGTEAYVIHFSQEPSIQNYDGQIPSRLESKVSSQEMSVMNHSETQQQLNTNQHSLTQSILENGVHLRCGTKTEVITEKMGNESQGEESRHQEKGALREMSMASLIPVLQNVPLIPAAAAAVGICAFFIVWKLRK
ncbi:uncharacterized protein LOC143139748 [Alosa pseudoharengus]|uniref:uncharacterized protein LOC143139748 n=1 Tax=Alosa pseudoharengus TaxID=34774 RepID=UPI003F8ADFD9